MVEEVIKNSLGKTDTAIAYYFFESAQKESLSPCTFLRSILHQVLRKESLYSILQRRFERIFIGLNGDREPEIDELESLVLDICNKFQKVIILVDGINEAEPDDQRLILHFFKTLEQSQAIIKLFVTSRPEMNVPTYFTDDQFTHINIRAHEIQPEINNFIDSSVEKESKDGPLIVCGSDMIDEIKKTLKMKARGM